MVCEEVGNGNTATHAMSSLCSCARTEAVTASTGSRESGRRLTIFETAGRSGKHARLLLHPTLTNRPGLDLVGGMCATPVTSTASEGGDTHARRHSPELKFHTRTDPSCAPEMSLRPLESKASEVIFDEPCALSKRPRHCPVSTFHTASEEDSSALTTTSKIALCTAREGVWSCVRCSPAEVLRAFQYEGAEWAVSSAPERKSTLAAETSSADTSTEPRMSCFCVCVGSFSSCTQRLSEMSHRRTDPSAPTLTSCAPSSTESTRCTGEEWPCSTPIGLLTAADAREIGHSRMSCSSPEDARASIAGK
mmetsp:Transcript_29196/g.73292  ORF Transcript_29196/g.73292 Transcript_29196/m.73292 type:complete len:307 (-) Transcript_29196:1455-2375(-)